MKQRFTYLDVRAIVNELQSIPPNTYIQNIYSPSNRTYIFKLSIKKFLLLEPGTRAYTLCDYSTITEHETDKPNLSYFCQKMRKLLRRNKIKYISQIGFDRVMLIETSKYNIYIEFFSTGNIVITPLDSLLIVELYRPVKELGIEKGSVYVVNPVMLDFSYKMLVRVGLRDMLGLDKIVYDDVRSGLERVLVESGFTISNLDGKDVILKITNENKNQEKRDLKNMNDEDNKLRNENKNQEKRDSQNMNDEYNKLRNKNQEEYSFQNMNDEYNKLRNENKNQEKHGPQNTNDEYNKLRNENKNQEKRDLKNMNDEDNKSRNENKNQKKYGPQKMNDEYNKLRNENNNQEKHDNQNTNEYLRNEIKLYENDKHFIDIYNNFFNNLLNKFMGIKNYGLLLSVKGKYNNYIPYKLNQNQKEDGSKEFLSFNESLEEYYKKTTKTDDTKKKSKAVKTSQEKRIEELEKNIDFCDIKVDFLTKNRSIIEKIITAHQNVITYNLNWKDFERHKKKEKDVNEIIDHSDFLRKRVAVKMCVEENKQIVFDIDFSVNFNVNVNLIYDQKKKLKEKLEKTKLNIKKVVKSVEKKEQNKAKKKTEKIKRKLYWFERFHYFFTRNNKLVIAGKSAQDNDILVKKYLEKNDLYFHAEIQGGSSVILKNGDLEDMESIEEAASMALCLSSCWKGKVSTRVYFVNQDQVSKTTESGEYLKTGGFMIRGKKNFVDVFRLEYGIGILFKEKKAMTENDINKDLENMSINNFKNNELYKFIGHPNENMEIEHAFLVCGPWIGTKNLLYKEKLLPAIEKKGKLAAQIKKKFDLQSKDSIHFEAVKNIVINEYTGVLINNCRIGKQ